MSGKTMAEAIEDIAHRHQMGLFDIDVKNLAAALTAAGFGLAADAKAEAWDEGFDYARRESWTEEANPYRSTP